jgi:hypothetical protein
VLDLKFAIASGELGANFKSKKNTLESKCCGVADDSEIRSEPATSHGEFLNRHTGAAEARA